MGTAQHGSRPEVSAPPPPSLMAAPSPTPRMSQSQDRAARATQGTGLWEAPPCADPGPRSRLAELGECWSCFTDHKTEPARHELQSNSSRDGDHPVVVTEARRTQGSQWSLTRCPQKNCRGAGRPRLLPVFRSEGSDAAKPHKPSRGGDQANMGPKRTCPAPGGPRAQRVPGQVGMEHARRRPAEAWSYM